MKCCDAQEVLKHHYDDPCFFIDFYNLGRGIVGYIEDDKPYIKRTKNINCWRIDDDKLIKVNDKVGILFDTETYLVQWTFEFIVDNSVSEESLFYYWKGNNASKAFSPLPTEVEKQNPVVERICQWSEPALFFHMFPKSLVVFSCKHDDFNPDIKRLFIVRGEVKSEIHLYEVSSLKASLRSRTIFLLIEPSLQTIFHWYGASVPIEYEQLVNSKLNLNEYVGSCSQYKKIEVREGQNDKIFLEMLSSEGGNYVSIKNCTNFTPRLFYFNSITGDFLATEVEYPLRNSKCVAPFPFLQSHLYTATQPALFLLDNNREVWLWEGWKTQDSNLELFKSELELAKKIAIEYSKEKEKCSGFSIRVKHILAGLEPINFINIFPYWNKRGDVTDIQIKEGYGENVITILK